MSERKALIFGTILEIFEVASRCDGLEVEQDGKVYELLSGEVLYSETKDPSHKQHPLWFIDAEGKPVALVSQQDAVKVLKKQDLNLSQAKIYFKQQGESYA